ncbi:MAG: DNA primase DnaG [Parcubacteria group bacterium]|jgi:DNA primase
MAKISPVSIKYMIHANFSAEGALEKPDVIGALFGQTEGLLGPGLEMRELQKEGKIGRIEVDLERNNKMTTGLIKIPTALDQSETTLIAAAIETIERIGPSDAQIEVEKIEDVRGSKRDYIIERAKKLMQNISGSTDSREISSQIKESARVANVKEYGEGKLPCGDLVGNEIIVVEGRADVVNMIRNGVNNIIGMNGTKMPDEINKLGEEKELTLFVDGDRGGKLIVQNVSDNANIKYVAVAPDGKEVEELTGKEIWMALRKKIPLEEFLSKKPKLESREVFQIGEAEKERLKAVSEKNEGSGKAILLDSSLAEMKSVSARSLISTLRGMSRKPSVMIIDGTVTPTIIHAAEETQAKVIVAKNFAATSSKLQLLSF